MEKTIYVLRLTLVTLILCGYVLTAYAIPCSDRVPGNGLTGSMGCLNGAPGDNTLGSGDDKAFDLNAGNYFGFNDWRFLQLQFAGSSLGETEVDVGLDIEPYTNFITGPWSIFESAWDDFDNFAIILKSEISGEDLVFWSAYLLNDNAASGIWHTVGRPLSSISIFGRVAAAIPEPTTWSMVMVGLAALVWAGTIRNRRAIPATRFFQD